MTRSIMLLLLSAPVALIISCGAQQSPSTSKAPAQSAQATTPARPAPAEGVAAKTQPEHPAPAVAPAPRKPQPKPVAAKPAEPEPIMLSVLPSREPAVVAMRLTETDEDTGFAGNAFPPTMPDTDWHRTAWFKNDCLRCHETGVGVAPLIVHDGLPEVLLTAKCRSCHVIARGQPATVTVAADLDSRFADNAFPPMMPNSDSHRGAWTGSDCLMCHETGVLGAPLMQHEGMPTRLRTAKCRSCHVQVRSHLTDPWERP